MNRRVRYFHRWFIKALIIGVSLAVVGLWLTFQHKPAWYSPVEPTEIVVRRARRETTALADDISDQLVSSGAFDVVVSDESVNEWLAALPALLPKAKKEIPAGISDLAVRFDANRLRIGAHYAKDGWRAIVGAVLGLSVSDDGKTIAIALIGAQGGSLPMPRAIIHRVLEQFVQSGVGDAADFRQAGRQAASAIRKLRSVDQLFEGTLITNQFIWPNGDRPFRIDSIAITDGKLSLRIEPL